MSTLEPLFPDTPRNGDQCWNCGKLGAQYYRGYFTYACTCGCGWSDRPDMTSEKDALSLIYREEKTAKKFKVRLVDFTKAGAPSAPA